MSEPAFRTTADDHLDRLVADATGFSVEFPHLLSNHLPMVLFALRELGGDDARLEAYFAGYRDANGLVPVPPQVAPIDAGTWRDSLGDRTREADYRTFFGGEARRLGRRGILTAYLPELAPGIAASATHSLMRMAYACLRDDRDEAAVGLAYLACTWLPLRLAGGKAPDTRDPAAILADMRAEDAFRHIDSESDLLWHWMQATAALPAFDGAVDRLDVSGDGLARVAAVSLRLMAATMTFEAVHAVTGTHWLRMLAGNGCDDALLRYFWQAIAAVYPKIGMPELPDEDGFEAMRQADCPGWAEICAAARVSADEHDLSYTFSAREEEKQYGDRLYRVTAARRLGLIA